MKKLAFIINDRIRKKAKILSDIESVFDSTYQKAVFITQHKGHAIDLAQEALKDGYSFIISVGGDGTINEVANGFMRWEKDHGNRTTDGNIIKLGILPYGSGNDLARTLNIKPDFYQLRLCIDRNSYNVLDLGHVQYIGKTGSEEQRFFLNIADVGMGAEVARKIDSYPKWMGANFSYQRGIISTLIKYKNQEVIVDSVGYYFSGKVLNLVLANGCYFGSGLGIAPEASPISNSLSIVNIGEIGLLDYFKQLKYVRRCEKLKHPAIHYGTANDVSVSSPNGPIPIEMDGEFIGHTPMAVSIIPSALNLLGPKIN